MTTATEVFEAMLAHHAALTDGLSRRVAALRSAHELGAGFEPAAGELLAYLASEVLPHAAAEEGSVYRTAATKDELASTVTSMLEEHELLGASADRLAAASDSAEALAEAEALERQFVAHVAKENEIILPSLVADEGVDMASLLGEMHRLIESSDREPGPRGTEEQDPEKTLVRLVLEACGQLAEQGAGDDGCRLAARAWLAVRRTRPDLGVRITAALHRLVREVTAEPITLSGGPGSRAGSEAILDVRELPPAARHQKIFTTYEALLEGESFVLVNDHDPKPLRYQFEAEHSGHFTWESLEAGPVVWSVRIARPADRGDRAKAADEETELDVRRLPHGRRHDVIFTAYEGLGAGSGFVLVNDHDPRPLRYQFEAQHAGAYSWDYLQAGPQVWRIRIGRTVPVGS